MSPDQICETHAKKEIALKVWVEEDTVFLAGDTKSLIFLSELISAQANFQKDDGFAISPNDAGKIFFKKDSTHGIYIHRIERDE